jgi:hypothetical protein
MKTRTLVNSWTELIKAVISFFIPGKALIVLRGLKILRILSDFNLTVDKANSRILNDKNKLNFLTH